MKIESAAMHGTPPSFGRVEACAKPFEVRSVSSIHRDFQKARRWQLQSVLRLALYGFRQFLRSHLAERQIDGRQMLAIEGVEFRIVGGTVFRPVPPAPIASFRGKQ